MANPRTTLQNLRTMAADMLPKIDTLTKQEADSIFLTYLSETFSTGEVDPDYADDVMGGAL